MPPGGRLRRIKPPDSVVPSFSGGASSVRALVFAVLCSLLLWTTLRTFPAGRGSRDPLSPTAIRERIRRYRTALAFLTVLGPDGQPLAGAPVVLRQTRHRFLFGSNAYGLEPGDAGPQQQA